MILRFAAAAIALSLLLNSTASAQATPHRKVVNTNVNPSDASWPENYILSLTGKDGETSIAEITIMLAGPTFSADSMSRDPKKEPTVTFAGVASRGAEGGLTIQYTIGMEIAAVASVQTSVDADGKPRTQENIQYKTSTARSTVRLNPGEAAEILRTGSRVWRLALDRVAAQKEE